MSVDLSESNYMEIQYVENGQTITYTLALPLSQN